jgi:hypothetical protein
MANFSPHFFMIFNGIPEPLLKQYKVKGEFSFTLPTVADGYELEFKLVEAAVYNEAKKTGQLYRSLDDVITVKTHNDKMVINLIFHKKPITIFFQLEKRHQLHFRD